MPASSCGTPAIAELVSATKVSAHAEGDAAPATGDDPPGTASRARAAGRAAAARGRRAADRTISSGRGPDLAEQLRPMPALTPIRSRHRQESQAGLDRAVAVDELHPQDEEEEDREDAGADEQRRRGRHRARVRVRNRRNGTSGCWSGALHRDEGGEQDRGQDQHAHASAGSPSRSCCPSPARRPTPSAAGPPAPRRGRRSPGRARHGSRARTAARRATAATAIGTLTNSTHRQLTYSVSKPPRIRPMAAPPAVMADQMPSARLRSLPSAKTTVSSDSAAGTSARRRCPAGRGRR